MPDGKIGVLSDISLGGRHGVAGSNGPRIYVCLSRGEGLIQSGKC